MNRLGLALSGGGFRATLYHLGVIRCLRDAEVLPRITHITTVSGGSIVGAHLALNWDRYCGTPEQFNEAAAEIIRFVQLDVRNRIVRRFPFSFVGNCGRSLLRLKTHRQWTRPGLLERYYERFLYGDTPLSQLPDNPRIHILSTNLSEGCLCSFNQHGLLAQRRIAGHRDRFERVHLGLATVPMAVAASSCFPGFFPPLELTGWDVGADVGEFTRQAFTDGGVYDNLGLRMFRCLEQSWVRHSTPLRKDDFLALEDTISALCSAKDLPDETPLRRLRKLIDGHVTRASLDSTTLTHDEFAKEIVAGLWEVIRSEKLYHDPVLGNCELDDTSAQSLLSFAVDSRRELEVGDCLWLNRLIVDAAIHQVIGRPCLRLSKKTFDCILVSDAGGKFKVSPDTRGGGLISTAIRSSDILMNRVWQLESEAFDRTTGVVSMPITEVVARAQNPHALDPEVQRQTSNIRTDLDYFTDVEISSLVQHGYGVAQQNCRRHEQLLGGEIPDGTPWDPIGSRRQPSVRGSGAQAAGASNRAALRLARQLRASSKRKIVSTLLSLRDWPSYIWLLMIVLFAVGVPSFVLERSARLKQQESVLSAVAELNPDYRMILDLLQDDQLRDFTPMTFEGAATLAEPELSDFEVISESRVFDLRAWHDLDPETQATGFSRTRVRRLAATPGSSLLRLQRELELEEYLVDCKSESLSPRLSRMEIGEGLYRWELQLDLSRVPLKSDVEIVTQTIFPPELASVAADEGRFNFTVRTDTGLLQVWLLMPPKRDYDVFEVSSYPIDQPELSEIVVPAASVRVALDSVATFQLINPEPQRRYECRWTWDKSSGSR